jgi:hypothetical protein
MEKSGRSGGPLFRRKRKRWPRSVWVKELKAFRDSSLTAEEYAAKQGIHVLTLRRWARRLGDEGEAGKQGELPAFVPVNVVRPTELQPCGKPFLVEVDLVGGRRVRARVGSDADARRLAHLLDTLDGGDRC